MERIKVEGISQYGVLSGGQWFNFGKSNGLKPEMFKKGAEYEVETVQGTKGGKLIVSYKEAASNGHVEKKVSISTTERPTISGPTKYGKPMSEYEVLQDKRIHVSGLLQAVISSPVLVGLADNADDLVELAKDITTKLVKAAKEIVETV